MVIKYTVKKHNVKKEYINSLGIKISQYTQTLNVNGFEINYGINNFTYSSYPYYFKLENVDDKLDFYYKNLKLNKNYQIKEININDDINPNDLIKKIINIYLEKNKSLKKKYTKNNLTKNIFKQEINFIISHDVDKDSVKLLINDEENNKEIIITAKI